MDLNKTAPAEGSVFHVSLSGCDNADGTAIAPLRTISEAARRAFPGDTILIHAGIYRERIDPPRGGDSPHKCITYTAAEDGPVEIRGSEIVTGWKQLRGDLWQVQIADTFFGGFNPYRQPLRGHWFVARDRIHHAGAVFAGNHWLIEAATLAELEETPAPEPRWFCKYNEGVTTFWAEFPQRNPNDGTVEITARQTVFYPSREGCNFITVRGLILSRAATPWSPPTTEQIGLLGTNWSRGWVIENNVVRHSCCAGITLGKYHDPEDHPESDVVEGSQGEDTYHGTIRRALAHGWSLESVGNHLVRHNEVAHCEMAGICGSFGAVRSRIESNIIHHIHVRRLFGGFEQAGIKFHGAIDTLISGNRIFHCVRGIWLDWMSQGTRVTRNLLYHNGPEPDLFTEVNHGPFLVDHNLFLSARAVDSWSEGGAYIRNFFLGRVFARAERGRITPYHRPHSTAVVEMRSIGLGDDRYMGNVFAHPDGLSAYNSDAEAMQVRGNLYLGSAKPSPHDTEQLTDSDFPVASFEVVEKDSAVFLSAQQAWSHPTQAPVSSDGLGAPALVGAAYENPDGTPVDLSTGYFRGTHGDQSCGPFEQRPQWPCRIWPVTGWE